MFYYYCIKIPHSYKGDFYIVYCSGFEGKMKLSKPEGIGHHCASPG